MMITSLWVICTKGTKKLLTTFLEGSHILYPIMLVECRVSVSLRLILECRPIYGPSVGCRLGKNRQCRVSENTPLWDLLTILDSYDTKTTEN